MSMELQLDFMIQKKKNYYKKKSSKLCLIFLSKLVTIVYMKKIKRFFKTIFVFFMCFACICLSACSGGIKIDDIDPEEIEDFKFGINLDNVKVLRRSYGSNRATAIATGYYSEYVHNVVRYLIDIYGLINNSVQNATDGYINIFQDMLLTMDDKRSDNVYIKNRAERLYADVEYEQTIKDILEDLQKVFSETESGNDTIGDKDNFKYFYDAVRYQVVDEIIYYTAIWRRLKADGTYEYSDGMEDESEGWESVPNGRTTDPIDGKDAAYTEVIVDTSNGWNWSINYEIDNDDDPTTGNANSFILDYNINKNYYENYKGTGRAVAGQENQIWNRFITHNVFGNIINGFSYEFVKMYYNADAEIELFGQSAQFSPALYTSQFYSPVSPMDQAYDSTNAPYFQKALEYAVYCILNKEEPHEVRVTKAQTGSTFSVDGYDNVDKALEYARNKYLDTCAYVGITTESDDPGKPSDKEKIVDYILNNVIGSAAIEWSESDQCKQKMYYRELVDAVVTYCTALTSIGDPSVYTDEDEEVIDGYKNAGDTKHSAVTIGGQYLSSDIVDYEYNTSMVNGQNDGIEEFAHLGEYEYQSMMLMPESDTKIDEIWLDFGYLGDYVGTNDSIEIKTYIRYYQGDGRMRVFEDSITVQERSVDVGEDGTTLMFDFAEILKDEDEQYLRMDKINFNRSVNSEYYKQRKLGVLQPSSSEFSREITFGPREDARSYYKYIQGKYRDYGVFDYTQLIGKAYDSHYVEIAFEVVGATCSNYKFLCGMSMLTQYIPPEERGAGQDGKLIPFQ